MHAQRQRSVLLLISESVLHLIAVTAGDGAAVDIFHREIKAGFFNEIFHLTLFQSQLFLIRKRLVGAAAADTEMLTRHGPVMQSPEATAQVLPAGGLPPGLFAFC